MLVPVINDASSEAKNNATFAISEGSANLFNGTESITSFLNFSNDIPFFLQELTKFF